MSAQVCRATVHTILPLPSPLVRHHARLRRGFTLRQDCKFKSSCQLFDMHSLLASPMTIRRQRHHDPWPRPHHPEGGIISRHGRGHGRMALILKSQRVTQRLVRLSDLSSIRQYLVPQRYPHSFYLKRPRLPPSTNRNLWIQGQPTRAYNNDSVSTQNIMHIVYDDN